MRELELGNTTVRVSNPKSTSANATFDLQGFGAFTTVSVSQLHSEKLSGDNPPSDPMRYSPKTSSMPFVAGAEAVVPANSFAISSFS